MADDGHYPMIIDERMRGYHETAAAFIKRVQADSKNPCEAIDPSKPEWPEWVDYFRSRVGSVPVAMRMVEQGRSPSYTVPAKHPEWFDMAYIPRDLPEGMSAIDHRPEPSWQERQRVEEGFVSLSRELRAVNLSMKTPKPLPEDRISRTLADSIERDDGVW